MRAQTVDLAEIERRLRRDPGALGFRGLADARLVQERRLLESLREVSAGTVGQLRAAVAGEDPAAIEPAALWEMGRRLGRAVEVRPSREIGRCDAAFAKEGGSTCALAFPEPPVGDVPLGVFANQPLRVAARRRRRHELGLLLREGLVAALPNHLVPGAIVVVDALPRTPNGKLDRTALARRPAERREPSLVWMSPEGETETTLAALWGELLGVHRIGAQDDFFSLGGHSLLVARLLHRVQARFGVALPLRRLFEAPTLRRFAAAVEAARREDASPAPPPPDLAADSQLDPTIRPGTDVGPPREGISDLFLTGATGFVGCFLVDELLRRTTATLHCLVRGSGVAEARARLRARLLGFGLAEAAESPRLRLVLGDLARPRFGLSAEAFAGLAEGMDAIVHCGAQVNFLYPYEALKPANVDGTREVLQLAHQARLKPVHHISTVGVFGGQGPGRYLEDDSFTGGVRARGGYSQSKWVAERLVVQARERGLPASIYRLGTVTGHSRAGTSNPSDFLSRLIRGCVWLGLAPEVGLTQDMTPVDYVTAAIVRLAFLGDHTARTYHLVSGDRFRWPELLRWLGQLGYPLRVVPPGAWVEAVRTEAGGETAKVLEPLLPLLTAFAHEAEAVRQGPIDDTAGGMHFDCRNVEAALNGDGLACPRLEPGLVGRYVDYFVRSGMLPPPSDVGA